MYGLITVIHTQRIALYVLIWVCRAIQQEGKLETLPRLLKMGLTLEQVAEALDLDIEVVRQAVPRQP